MTDELDDFLMHYGVKGMKWGVRKDRDGMNRAERRKKDPTKKNAVKKLTRQQKKELYKASLKRQLNANAASYEENNKKFLAKAGFTEKDEVPDTKKRWKPTGKQIAWAALGATALAYWGYGMYLVQKDKKQAAAIAEKLAQIKPAQKVDNETYLQLAAQSKMNTWLGPNTKSGGYLQPSSYARDAFEIPAGNTFNRISRVAEDSFTGPTYTTHSKEDFNRYVSAFRQELGGAKMHHVTFKTDKAIKVPKLNTTRVAMQQAMEGRVSSVMPISMKDATNALHKEHGGTWKGERSKDFFNILKSQGYGAIVDEMDAGVIGETPLVLFATEMFGKKSSTELTDLMIMQAEDALTEIIGRK